MTRYVRAYNIAMRSRRRRNGVKLVGIIAGIKRLNDWVGNRMPALISIELPAAISKVAQDLLAAQNKVYQEFIIRIGSKYNER